MIAKIIIFNRKHMAISYLSGRGVGGRGKHGIFPS